MWKEHKRFSKKIKLPLLMEKYQFIFIKGDTRISLVQFTPYLGGERFWEIHQTGGAKELFEDVERYYNKKAALKRIRELYK